MRLYNPALLVVLILFPILTTAQTVQTPEDYFQGFSDKLDSLRIANNIPGLAAAVVQHQELVWSKGYGMSHFDTGDGAVYRPVTPDTPFWIASVTKTFLGLLFLQLEEQDKISLDDPINNMPGWENFCSWLAQSVIIFGQNLRCEAPITIRNVLNHTVNGKPGTSFSYNPIMYSRLSRYIEYIYGNPIQHAEGRHNTMAQLIQQNILAPAGMERTMASQWQQEKTDVFFDMAQGYGFEDDRFTRRLRPERHLAGGAGIVSTVEDLAQYDIAIDSGLLASASVMKKLFAPAKTPDGKTLPYAFGWYVQQFRDEKLVWHSGWDEQAGFSALYLKVPAQNLTFILLANSGGLWWGNPLDEAQVEKSVFARVFLNHFVFRNG